MRLLHTTEQRFEEFFQQKGEDGFPKYAILSHRWSRDELTYEEMEFLLLSKKDQGRVLTPRLLRLQAKLKGDGYAKVMDFRDFAADEGYDWVWIDTVCIDKTSSAELSEAINSMWNWYSWAATCYAYLPEVPCCKHCKEDWKKPGFSKWASYLPISRPHECVSVRDAFAHSEWHTRCWTLQELLAPEKVVFVDRAWHKVSNKETWLTELCTITGIAAGALENVSYVGGFTAADRFSWAATRRTTRVEDAAYSLLGVFGVNMPLLYGERHRAFERLCREILREIGDPTVLGHNGDTLYPDRAALFSKRSVTDTALSLYQPEELATWRSEAIPTSLDRGVLLRHIPYIRITPDESEHHVIIALPAWKGSRMIGLERHNSYSKREEALQ